MIHPYDETGGFLTESSLFAYARVHSLVSARNQRIDVPT